MKKKILVTGSNGLLGQKLVYALIGHPSFDLIAAGRGLNRVNKKDGYEYAELDISDAQQTDLFFAKHHPDIVINTAAMTNVDACESQKEECKRANVDGVRNIVSTLESLAQNGKIPAPHLIHISTDFVFDGENGPYSEEDKPNPLSYYAWSKLEGEKIVKASKIKWSIARTIIVYGLSDNNTRSNMVLWVKNSLEKGNKINVVNDQFRCPTFAQDLATGCVRIAEKGTEGIYHLCGPESMSMLEMAYRIADFWKLDRTLITPVSSAFLNQPAKRPPRTGFVIEKARKQLGFSPGKLEQGLKIMAAQM